MAVTSPEGNGHSQSSKQFAVRQRVNAVRLVYYRVEWRSTACRPLLCECQIQVAILPPRIAPVVQSWGNSSCKRAVIASVYFDGATRQPFVGTMARRWGGPWGTAAVKSSSVAIRFMRRLLEACPRPDLESLIKLSPGAERATDSCTHGERRLARERGRRGQT
ncbi:hypothetical protein K504DRAFT_453912 [Pleomassaria siparia CBS 279.74]|uniref:Uncharacterized protein n=1 Tax=Pleomassaria siparia CBS 279.74 TaxID=1314801 RepID=A0A6G1KEK9_9PLEO|nr:hypothetical protein K504DRAFT_453912 [Pleomassaria siparia CBS 279.74]